MVRIRSGFLSAFFALVGTHGLHVTSGLIWMAVLMFQVSRRGLTSTNRTRILCLSLFWHFPDVVWILRVLGCLSDGGDVMSHSTNHSGASHGSVKSYMTGFILSIILTVIPFAMVMSGSASHAVILGTILVTAVVQIVVHLVYFLHMNSKSDEGWNLTAFIFTVIIIAIVVVGSIWIMWNLNYNMMMH